MLYIPRVVCQSHELGLWEMSDNCFCVENHINLVQASQKPVENHLNASRYLKPENIRQTGERNPPYQSYCTYNTDMVTIVKPVPYLYTTARNKPI